MGREGGGGEREKKEDERKRRRKMVIGEEIKGEWRGKRGRGKNAPEHGDASQ